MRAILRAVAPALFVAVAFSTSPLFSAWPPTAESSAEELHASLLAEVRAIALDDPDPVRRGWAWRALRRAGDEEPTKRAERGLADESPFVRSEAAVCLKPIVDRDDDVGRAARRAIVKTFKDPSVHVVDTAFAVASESQRTTDWSGLGIEEDPLLGGTDAFYLLDRPQTADAFWKAVFELLSRDDERWRDLFYQSMDMRSDAPAEYRRRVIALGRASKHAEFRFEAIERSETDPVARVEAFLADSNSEVRRAAFVLWNASDGHDRLRPLLERALFDADDAVAREAIFWVRAHGVEIAVDRERIVERFDGDSFPRMEIAAMILLRLDTQPLGRDERIAYLAATRERFLQSPPNSRERRAAAGVLARFVVDQHTFDGLGPWSRGHDRLIGVLPRDVAIPHVAKTLVVLTEGARDPDPYVRLVACKAIADASGPALHDGKFTPAQAAAAWRAIATLAEDERVQIRNALAVRFDKIEEEAMRDPECRRDVEAAAIKLLGDPEPRIARGAARVFVRHGWRAEAAPVLLAQLAEEPPVRDYVSTRGRLVAARTLLRHAPDVVPPEAVAKTLAEPLLFAQSSGELPPAHAAALERLLKTDSLERYFVFVERSRAYVDRELVERTRRSDRWDDADVRDALEFAASLGGERSELIHAVLSIVRSRPADVSREPLSAILREPTRRPGLTYAMLDHDEFVESPGLADAIASGDPVACLLGIQTQGRRGPDAARGAAFADAPAYVQTLAAEAARRFRPRDVATE